ncbi:MAG: copper transport protein [Gaiellaceae bacterium]|nr:copper transport protein [Gaiellaceae bacterium]
MDGRSSVVRLTVGGGALAAVAVAAVGLSTKLAPQRANAAQALVPARVLAKDVPTGPFTSAREDGDLAVGFAAVPSRAGHIALTATVIGSDGKGATALHIGIALVSKIERHGSAVACAPGCYRVTLPFVGRPTEAVVSIRRPGHRPSAVRFNFPSIWTPPSGVQIVRAATAAFLRLRSVTIDEYLRSSLAYTAHTRWRLEAPDRLTYTAVRGGAQGVVIGNRRWDRSTSGKWVESAQLPLHQPTPTWGSAPLRAALLGSGRVDGHEVWRVSFVDPNVPAWYTAAIDKRTLRTLAVQMVAPAHFMRHTYFGFNTAPTIRPPK